MMRFVEIFMTAAAASVRTCLFKNKINQFHFQNGKFEEVEFFGAREIHFDLTNLHFEDASRHGTIKMEIWHPNEMNELQNIRNLQMIYFCIEIFFLISFCSIWTIFAALFILCACDQDMVGDETFLDEEATAFIQKNFPNAMKVGEMKVEDLSENDIQAPDQQWFGTPFFSWWGGYQISKWKL